jgi:hypothetical protein
MTKPQVALVGEGGLEPPHPFGHRNLKSVPRVSTTVEPRAIVPFTRDDARFVVQTMLFSAHGLGTVREHSVSIWVWVNGDPMNGDTHTTHHERNAPCSVVMRSRRDVS